MTTILLLCAVILMVAFTYKNPPTTDIDILRDITDKHLAQPDATTILPFYNLVGEEKWHGGIFRFANLSDVSYNPAFELTIDPANPWLSNQLARDKQIQKFRDSVSTVLADAQKETIGKENSSLYLPIARELNRLSGSTAQRRILIIYSDLMENDLDFSLYGKDQLGLIQLNPDSLTKTFEEKEPLNQLTGIEVYFIYQAADAEQDREYSIVSEFYKNMLESKGATVHIAANLLN